MIVYVLIGVLILLYLFLKWNFSYWSREGLEEYQSGFLDTIGPKIYNAYFNFKRKGVKHGGTFLYFKSVYVPVDLDTVKNIMQNDFDHFVNRGILRRPPTLFNDLVNMEDEEWKMWRSKLTPTFTSGKMKMMFNTIKEKASMLEEVFKEQATINEPIDMKDIASRYTTDVIGSTIFGIECNSLKNPNAEFRVFAKQFPKTLQKIVILTSIPPVFQKLLRSMLIPKNLETFFLKTIGDTINYRESNNVYKKDFMHLLLQLKNKGKIVDDDENVLSDKNTSMKHITLDQIAAQCFVFFNAGYETSATTMTFAMLELAQNQEIQDKLRKEIRDVLTEYGEEITYEAIMKMEYLDKVVHETLRKHPSVQLFPRVCNKDYPVPGTNYTIKKGQSIFLPFRAIHHDPDHWPEPETFDPERFSAENKAKRHKFAFLAFGEGPRVCIGARFGLLQSKIGIASIIKNHKLTLSDKNPKPLTFDYNKPLINVNGILWMNVEKAV